jgi:truncated hemoglobin YjbI
MKEIPLSKPQLKAIVEDLGEEKIRAILTDFYERMSRDTMLGFFFF